MKEYRIRCPCCNEYITVVFSDIGEVSSVFFDAENATTHNHHYDFGFDLKGGE